MSNYYPFNIGFLTCHIKILNSLPIKHIHTYTHMQGEREREREREGARERERDVGERSIYRTFRGSQCLSICDPERADCVATPPEHLLKANSCTCTIEKFDKKYSLKRGNWKNKNILLRDIEFKTFLLSFPH